MNYLRLSNLFAVPLMEFNYGEISDTEYSKINEYLKDLWTNSDNKISNDSYILDKDFPELKKFFETSIATYVETVVVGDEYDHDELNFQITQSWLNLTEPGHNHHHHTHANSFISGVFYVKANAQTDNITFSNNLFAFDSIQIEAKKYNQFNSERWKLPVETGRLLLFPSSTPHGVEHTTGDEDRISLSFNVFPFGIIGSKNDLTELRTRQYK